MGSAIKLFTTAAILLIGGLMAPQVVHMQGVSLVDESGPPTGVKQVSDDYSRVEPAQQLSACYNIRKQKMNKGEKEDVERCSLTLYDLLVNPSPTQVYFRLYGNDPKLMKGKLTS
jgi:hypothetical protein